MPTKTKLLQITMTRLPMKDGGELEALNAINVFYESSKHLPSHATIFYYCSTRFSSILHSVSFAPFSLRFVQVQHQQKKTASTITRSTGWQPSDMTSGPRICRIANDKIEKANRNSQWKKKEPKISQWAKWTAAQPPLIYHLFVFRVQKDCLMLNMLKAKCRKTPSSCEWMPCTVIGVEFNPIEV